jgi:pilus assembly protein Flp/PilA
MSKLIKKFVKDEEGAALIEYSILIGIIAVAVIGSIVTIAAWIAPRWATLAAALT